MNREAFRIALRADRARECLTDRQLQAVDAFLEDGTVAGTAKRLDISRQAAKKLLRFALKKFEAFAESISSPTPRVSS